MGLTIVRTVIKTRQSIFITLEGPSCPLPAKTRHPEAATVLISVPIGEFCLALSAV